MQIDYHHTVTYTLARLAGFESSEANIIASSAQYVDDSIHDGEFYFKNRASYSFMASAHRMLDYRNYRELANHTSWIPFHFIPGNLIKYPEHKKVPDFVQRLITVPNSSVARQMLDDVLEKKGLGNSLHYLGVVMHAYADTWAHQGFCGIDHEVNIVKDILNWDGEVDHIKKHKVKKYFKKNLLISLKDLIKSWVVGKVSPLGHGPALSFPDAPYLKWKYVNYFDDLIERDNTEIFMDASKHLYEFLYFYKNEKWPSEYPTNDFLKIKKIFETNVSEEEKDRHQYWLNELKNGVFSFGAEDVNYLFDQFRNVPGIGLLPENKLCIEEDQISFDQEFMTCHWKFVQDAIFHHQVHMLHKILPGYNICMS